MNLETDRSTEVRMLIGVERCVKFNGDHILDQLAYPKDNSLDWTENWILGLNFYRRNVHPVKLWLYLDMNTIEWWMNDTPVLGKLECCFLVHRALSVDWALSSEVCTSSFLFPTGQPSATFIKYQRLITQVSGHISLSAPVPFMLTPSYDKPSDGCSSMKWSLTVHHLSSQL